MQVQDFLVKGLPRNELEASIQKIFRGADGDGSGALDRREFLRCLKESGLGFTRRELNLVLSELDESEYATGSSQERALPTPSQERALPTLSPERALSALA